MLSIVRFIKGMCMGFADVVPGVSGGTVALVLGIYVQFIEAIKSLNISWFPPLIRWIASGFDAEHLADAKHHFLRIHWSFLIPLGMGIVAAFAIGSRVIPPLMEDHPALMRAFFMGLVLASIVVPWKQVRKIRPAIIGMVLLVAAGTYFLVGAGGEAPVRWSTFQTAETTTFKQFVRQHPSTRDPLALYCSDPESPSNSELRTRVAELEENDIQLLDRICERLERAGDDVELYAMILHEHHLEDSDQSPFDQLVIPAETPVEIPQPAFWFVFVCGLLAICAMVLPGISGSFILLMLGAYYFVLSSIKGSIEFLLGTGGDFEALLYVSLFSAGALIGITSFVRLLSWLFDRYHDMTLAALVGLMIGSLRVLWPFKLGSTHGGPVKNIMPGEGDPLVMAVFLVVVGFALVAGLSALSVRIDRQLGEDEQTF